MWRVEYEQCPRGHTWEFKLDHVPLDDGRWHRVNRQLRAVYRVDHEAIQYCTPGDSVPEDEWQALLADLKACGPIVTHHEVQLIIERCPEGYRVLSPFLPAHPGILLADLNGPDLTAAYRELRRQLRKT